MPEFTKMTISNYFQGLEDPASEEVRMRTLMESRLQPTHVDGTPTIFLMGLRR